MGKIRNGLMVLATAGAMNFSINLPHLFSSHIALNTIERQKSVLMFDAKGLKNSGNSGLVNRLKQEYLPSRKSEIYQLGLIEYGFRSEQMKFLKRAFLVGYLPD